MTAPSELRALLAKATEPRPKPLPEQDTRVGEAMAGRADDEARKAWEERTRTAKDEIVNNASALLDEIEVLKAENDRLARAVVGGTLPGLLEDEEQVALVDFIKFLRSQSPSQGDAS